MTVIGQFLWLCLLLFCSTIKDFALEISHLICRVDLLSEFYLVHGIERNFRTTCGFFVVILTGLLCLYLIGYLLSSVFLLYLTYYSVTVQLCVKLFIFKDAG